jgi:threonine/homoserine/homoserine lactone efflux protein
VLVYLGVTAWRSARREEGEFGEALKLRLPRHGPVFGAAVILAAIQVVVIDAPYCAMIVLLASRARNWLSRAAIRRRLERVLGATLVGLGLDLAAAAR